MKFNDCRFDHQYSLTLGFHHDRGLVVFADSPRRGEYRALGRRSARRTKTFYVISRFNLFENSFSMKITQKLDFKISLAFSYPAGYILSDA